MCVPRCTICAPFLCPLCAIWTSSIRLQRAYYAPSALHVCTLCALPYVRPLRMLSPCANYVPTVNPLCVHQYAPSMRRLCAQYVPIMRPTDT